VKILIAGTGGVGGYYGARLAGTGHDVWFLARGATLSALRTDGLTIRSSLGDARLPHVQATATGADAGPADAVLVCVKTYDNDEVADAMEGAVRDGTALCSLQNGVENEDVFGSRFPSAIVLGGVARIEAFVESPGVIVQRGTLTSVSIGAFDPSHREAAARLVAAFDGTGVPADLVDDVASALWMKLLVIAGIGGLTAFGRCTIGEVRADPDLRELLISVMTEVADVAAARGIALPPDPVSGVVAAMDTVLDPDLTSSMGRDVERGRPLEVEALNGAVVRFGEASGVPTPANRRILDALLPLHRRALTRRRAVSR
jgi:2-dehydropantoate 2-reductase